MNNPHYKPPDWFLYVNKYLNNNLIKNFWIRRFLLLIESRFQSFFNASAFFPFKLFSSKHFPQKVPGFYMKRNNKLPVIRLIGSQEDNKL